MPTKLNPPTIADVTQVENKSGTQAVVEHLINAHGRRRIAYLQGPPGHEDSEWRELGYIQALKNHNIPIDPLLFGKGNFSASEAFATVLQWLAGGLDFDAIFAGDDESASGALAALRETGKRVPQDVSVVGFDDIAFARHLSPPLTTVSAPTEQVGFEAVQLLVNRIRYGSAAPQILLPTRLVIRQSCGCPAHRSQEAPASIS